MLLSLVVAVDEDNVIGLGNTLPWDMPADLRHFRALTEGHPVIMGRKTFESIVDRLGHPLPDRRNIVISHRGNPYAGDYDQVASLDDAIRVAEESKTEEAFVIGGGQIYALALPHADRIYLTRVHSHFAGDAWFPDIRESDWREISAERHEADGENPYAYTFFVYERKKESL